MSVATACVRRIVELLRQSPSLADSPDRVLVGAPTAPERAPVVYVTDLSLESNHGDHLGGYRRTLTVQLTGYVGAPTDEPGERALAALDLLSEIEQALERERSSEAGWLDVLVRGAALDGLELMGIGLGVVTAEVEVWWIADSGVGS